MSITRRDLLKLAGGSFLGMMFTPVPWKLLDDTAIWTQNWSLIPPLPRGPISTKYSTCALCPAGCAVQARCVNGHPFGLRGIANHPVNNGILCPMGLTGHHMSYHPLRLAAPCRFSGKKNDSKLIPATLDDIVSDISNALRGNTSVAILDQRPGRMISSVYQNFLTKFPTSYYLIPPSQESSTLQTIRKMAGPQSTDLGFDFENTRVILSFGAALLDGWGTPGRMTSLFAKRKDNDLRLIQVESNKSRTALQADQWLPIKPGTEATLALGIANILLKSGSVTTNSVADLKEFSAIASTCTPQLVADITGVPADRILETAEMISSNPSIILAGCDAGGGPLAEEANIAIACLNILLGNIGKRGGIVNRRALPGTEQSSIIPQSIAGIPDHSLRVLIVDGAESGYAIPWSLIQRKLVTEGSVVVSLSPYLNPIAAHADYLIPSSAQFESLEEVATPNGASVASFTLSTQLIPQPKPSTDPITFLKKLSTGSELSTTEALLKQRANAIHASKQGSMFSPVDGSTTRVSEIASADDFWHHLTNGACWLDDTGTVDTKMRFTLGVKSKVLQTTLTNAPLTLTMMPVSTKGTTATSTVSPVLSKIFQESDLRNISGRVGINPATAALFGLNSGDTVTVQSEHGQIDGPVTLNETVMPGVVTVAVGPSPNKTETPEHTHAEDVLALCTVREDGSWRLTDVTITKA